MWICMKRYFKEANKRKDNAETYYKKPGELALVTATRIYNEGIRIISVRISSKEGVLRE